MRLTPQIPEEPKVPGQTLFSHLMGCAVPVALSHSPCRDMVSSSGQVPVDIWSLQTSLQGF